MASQLRSPFGCAARSIAGGDLFATFDTTLDPDIKLLLGSARLPAEVFSLQDGVLRVVDAARMKTSQRYKVKSH